MIVEYIENIVAVPALMPELKRIGMAAWQHRKECIQAFAVFGKLRRKLKQDRDHLRL